jgi:ubiquinone/menaquinone biosynthesis C-methylase UbiE
MSEQRYFAGDQQYEAEFNRLRLMEKIQNPTTIRHLEMLGVSPGWNCLEVGAGAGSVAKWLSTRVGPTGKVVATDVDTRFLSHLSAPNLEIRRHDIIEDDLETDQFDLAHCRGVLMHLPKPEKALRQMANALRPGGWLLIEEGDFGSILSIDITNPAAADFTALLRTVFDFVRKRGIMDPYFGRRVRSLVEQLQFIDVGQEGSTDIRRMSDPGASFGLISLQMLQSLIDAGLLTQQQLESVERLRSDPDFYGPGPTMFAAWGRRPVTQT